VSALRRLLDCETLGLDPVLAGECERELKHLELANEMLTMIESSIAWRLLDAMAHPECKTYAGAISTGVDGTRWELQARALNGPSVVEKMAEQKARIEALEVALEIANARAKRAMRGRL